MVKIILLSILILIVLLLLLRVTLWVQIRDGETVLFAGVLWLRFQVYPPREKKRKRKPAKNKPSAASAGQSGKKSRPAPKKQSLSEQLQMVLEFLEPLPKPVKKLIRGICITKVKVYIRVAESDAASTAISYGKTCAIVHSALAVLRNIFTVQVKAIKIEPDFLSEHPAHDISFQVKLHVYTAVAAVAGYLWAYFKRALAKGKAAETIQPSSHGGKV